MTKSELTAEALRDLVVYDKHAGTFHRLKKTNRRVLVGARADFVGPRGYARISVAGVRIYAHQAAWLYSHGFLPESPLQIDHINGKKSDNRLTNLRAVTPSINTQNERAARTNSKSGLLGVHWSTQKKKWRASIRTGDDRLELGFFASKEQAHAAYLLAKRQHHSGCTI